MPWDVIYRFSSSQFDTNQNPTFSILFTCAPVQEIWFSTRRGLTSAQPDIGQVGPGDILSDSGFVVRRVTDLLQPLGVDPSVVSGADVDALSVAPGGELLLSLREDLVDAGGRLLRHGDLLSAKGTVFRTNPQLLQNFGVVSTNADVGLDGVELMESGAILFSITTNVYSEKLGLMLTAGDLLSDGGLVVSTEQNLLTLFQPNPQIGPYGLRGFHSLAPSEIWFCTEKGFQSTLGPIAAGDLLSTRGYVVVRNLDLVAKFRPIEDASDFGLDALFVIGPRSATSPTLELRSLSAAGVDLRWNTTARVSQLQAAPNGSGPYLPLSPIMTEMQWLDTTKPTTNRARFYRLQVW
jgi:hypothetical protein